MSETNVAVARAYLDDIAVRGDVARHLDAGVVYEEMPNRIKPAGARADRATMLTNLERCRRHLASERYLVHSAVGDGERVVLEVEWTGVLAVPVGNLQPGATMRTRTAMFLSFREGKIVHQRNYYCFDPF